jgi:7-cyano-7-deazaguanine reductase
MSTDNDPLLAGAPLGRAVAVPSERAPEVLFGIPRAPARRALGIEAGLPFRGTDRWTAWEFSWLLPSGRPVVAVAQFDVPAASPSIVESKSLKLYLGSYSETRLRDADEAAALLRHDLGTVCGAEVGVRIVPQSAWGGLGVRPWGGESLDGLDAQFDAGEPDARMLALERGAGEVEETLHSDLLRSKCPVTGQPDWGSVQIAYRGPRIDRRSLLRYLVSYRRHSAFHEHCVERIWCDIARACAPAGLTVHARYLRRGGVEINPFRSSAAGEPSDYVRLPRQ